MKSNLGSNLGSRLGPRLGPRLARLGSRLGSGRALRPVIAIAAALAVAGVAGAQPGPGPGPGGGGRNAGPCQADADRLCADVEQRGAARHRCLQQHRAELSPACREHLDTRHARMMERANQVRAACATDVERFCADVAPGEGGLIRCLRGHESELTPGCREALPPRGGGPRP